MNARACYNMDMRLKKTTGLLLALTISAGAFFGANPSFSAHADGEVPPVTEETQSVVFDKNNAKLHLPETYEQYLPLEAPAYMAMSEHYISVADGTLLYIYDREKSSYLSYDTKFVTNASVISKIQITDDERLFFSAGISLFEYQFSAGTADIVSNVSCNTFLVEGDYLYTSYIAANSQVSLKRYPLAELSRDNEMEITTVPNVSTYSKLTAWNGILYCVRNDRLLMSYDMSKMAPGESGQIGGFKSVDDKNFDKISDIKRICAYNDYLYYSVSGEGAYPNGLWRTDFNGNAELMLEGDGYSAITTYGGDLYCIRDASVLKLDVKDGEIGFTGYEIASSSSSPNRIANAGETVRTKELVAIADKGNDRISVFCRADGAYTTIPCLDGETAFTPDHIAIGKEEITVKLNGDVVTSNKIAVSNADRIYLYTLSRHSFKTEKTTAELTSVHKAPRNVKGLNFVYGECYYITEYNGYGSIGNETSSELHFNIGGTTNPEAIASDIYGTLYVAFGNEIYTYSEADFQKDGAVGTKYMSLSADSAKIYTSLSVDYEGNIWHLSADGKLYCNNAEKAQIDGKDFVYLNEEHDYPVSFALSFEDDEIYFNFQNYVVKTDAFALDSLVSLNKITAGEAKTEAFALAECDNLFVKVPAGSVGFEIDLDLLKTGESEYFPYERYFRSAGDGEDGLPRRGVLLYEPQDENGYYVVALYDEEKHTFSANLFKKSKNALEPDENYFEEKDETAYASSSVSLCSAPCLFPAKDGKRLSPLSDFLLERGTKVGVLGYAEGADRTYAFVEITGEARETVRGFIPRSYLTKTDPLGTADDHYKLGYLRGDAGTILKSENGETLAVTENAEAKLYDNGDGTYTAVVVKDGVVYSGIVTEDAILRGETDALRISLIVILSVLALVIIAGYIFLMFPRKKRK